MQTELESLLIDCKKWLNEFKSIKNKAAHKKKYTQYLEIAKMCEAYLAGEKMIALSESEKENIFPHFDSISFRCIDLVKKFTLTVEGDEGIEILQDDLIVSDGNSYTYIMEGYDRAEYDENDAVTICKKYKAFERGVIVKELEISISFETANQVYVDTKKIIIPISASAYEISVDVKWIPQLEIDGNNPEAFHNLSKDYQDLGNRISDKISTVFEKHLTVHRTNLIKLTTAYTTAYDNFNDALTAAKDAEALKAAWVNNMISIAGGGLLSYVSSTKAFLNFLKPLAKIEEETLESAINILEDISQAGWDKAWTTGSSQSAIKELKLDSPLSFQNNLEKEGIKLLTDTLDLVRGYNKMVLNKKRTLDGQIQIKLPSLNVEEEWDSFKNIYGVFLNIEDTLIKSSKKRFQIPDSLANNLELLLWARWIDIKETHEKVDSREGEWSKPVDLPLEKPIIERFSKLGLLDKLGIDLVTFEWSWDDEYKELRKWAKEFKPRPLF